MGCVGGCAQEGASVLKAASFCACEWGKVGREGGGCPRAHLDTLAQSSQDVSPQRWQVAAAWQPDPTQKSRPQPPFPFVHVGTTRQQERPWHAPHSPWSPCRPQFHARHVVHR